MDTLIKDGDFCLDGRGRPVVLEGVDELVQQALLRLTTKKGAFALDTTLGSELYRLRGCGRERMAALAQGYVEQALLPINGLSVEGVQCAFTPEGGVKLDVYLKANGAQSLVSLAV